MRKITLLLISIAITSFSFSREIINFNNNWVFGKSISNTTKSQKINVPHTWQNLESDPLFMGYRGGNQYLKEFSAPRSWLNKNVFIRFNGVASIANIFINGKYVGEHRGAFTAFTFDISPYLQYGTTNTILVNVDNSVQLDVMPLSGDFNIYGGIYRDVELIVTSKTHISTTHYSSDGVYVQQVKLSGKQASVNIKTMLDGPYGDKSFVKVELFDNDKVISSEIIKTTMNIDGKEELNFPMKIDNPRLWRGKKDPFQYKCVTTVYNVHNELMDQVEVDFGLRSAEIIRTDGFFLNKEKYPIYGVTYVQDRDEVYSAMSQLDIKADVEIIKELGATAVRTSNAPHSKYFYDLTDKNGIITWVDLPFTGDDIDKGASFINSVAFMENGIMQLKEIIYQLYNHPSIVFFGLFSNISGYGDNPINYIKELNTLSRTLAPTRLTVACSNEDGSINNITDAISWSQYLGWRSRKTSDINRWLNNFSASWFNLKPAIGEFGAGGSILIQDEKFNIVKEEDYRHSENYQTYFHTEYSKALKNRPYLWGYFINSMFDFGSSHRLLTNNPGKSDMGLITYNRHTKKDSFYLYKALWNKSEEFIYIAERRLKRRSGMRQTIKVFSSCRTVDLIVNNKVHSTTTVVDGIATWGDVILKLGKNSIKAVSGSVSDEVEIDIFTIL